MLLNNFLEKHKTTTNDFTHISLINGKYKIPENKIDTFYDILSKTEEYYLVERHLEDKSNLIIDIDLKVSENKRQMTDEIIEKIIYNINKIIDKIYINNDKIVYILQRDGLYKKDNIYKDGLHIIYPEIIGNYKILYLIRETILDRIKWLEDYSITSIEEIIDKSVIKSNGLIMYGGKKPGLEEYKLIKIYDNDMNILNNKNSKKELLEILSIRNNNSDILIPDMPNEHLDKMFDDDYNIIEDEDENEDEYIMKNKVLNIVDKNILRYILLKILNKSRAEQYEDWIRVGFCLYNISINNIDLWIEFSKRSNKYKKGECEKMWRKMRTPETPLSYNTLYYYCKKDNIDMLKDISIIKTLDNIKHEFPNNKLDINNIMKGYNYIYIDINDKYCPIYGKEHYDNSNYLEITKSGIIMKCRDCNCIGKIYPNNKEINITMNTINTIFNVTINNNYSLKEEDIEIEILNVTDDSILNNLLSDTLNCTNGKAYDLAKILYHLFNNEFRFDSRYKDWYYFKNRWIKCNNKLRTKISNDIVDYYKLMKNTIKKNYKQKDTNKIVDNNNINNIDNNNEIQYKCKIKKIDNLIGDLKTTAFKNNIIKEAEEIFTDNHENILDKLDNDVYLLGFNNGVYDIKNKCFREIRSDDYISMSVGYDYIDENSIYYDKSMELKLLTFLEEIQPEIKQREYVLIYLSTSLIGLNILQHFVVFLGEGRNGKGMITNLLSSTFGDYFSSFKSKLLTKPSTDANLADPMILDLRKRRICIGSEPEKNERINTGFTKLLTGRDKIKTRYNHGNDMIEFEVNFKIILLCNAVPEADQDDKAYRKRLKCIGFPTTFVDNPKNDNEKKINYNLNVDCFKQYFILLLIKYYNKYETEGLPQNEQIEDLTNRINTENNKSLEFMINKTEISEGNNIHTQTLYDKFKDWFYDNYPNEKIPSNRIFLQNIKLNYVVMEHVIINKKDSTGIKNIIFKI